MGRETEKSYLRRERITRAVDSFIAELRPRLMAEGKRRAEKIAREVEEDQYGYVWWHHWGPRSRKR